MGAAVGTADGIGVDGTGEALGTGDGSLVGTAVGSGVEVGSGDGEGDGVGATAPCAAFHAGWFLGRVKRSLLLEASQITA